MKMARVGRFLYFAPYIDTNNQKHGKLLRFDLSCRIDDASCYSAFATGATEGSSECWDAISDRNGYFYFAKEASCRISRYNSNMPLNDPNAYEANTCSVSFPSIVARTYFE